MPSSNSRNEPPDTVPSAPAVGNSLRPGLDVIKGRFAAARQIRTSWGGTLGGLVALCVVVLIFPYMGVSLQYINLAVVLFIYAMVASGMALLYHDGGLLSVAHGGLWGIGAYAAALLATKFNWQLVPILLVAAAITALAAMSLASISTRVIGSYFIIILFAVSEVIYGVMINWTGLTNGSEGIVLATPASLFGLQLSSDMQWYYTTFISLLLVLLVLQVIRQSRLGQHLRAIRDSRPLAMSVGISVARVHMATFAITGAAAGIAGVYWAYLEKYVVPSQYSTTASIEFVVVVLLGGSAYLLGPVLGGLVVIFLPSLVNLQPLLAEAIVGVVFIAVILLVPEGVVGLITRALRWLTARTLAAFRGGGPTPAAPTEGLGEV